MSNFEVGQCFSKKFILSETLVSDFAELVGDNNPIHLDSSYASKTFFGRRIAHGALIYGFISSILGVDFPGEGSVLVSQELSFIKPIFLDDAVTIFVKIIKIDKVKNNLILSINCLKNDKDANEISVLKGKTTVKYLGEI